jgi:hypothetical protein
MSHPTASPYNTRNTWNVRPLAAREPVAIEQMRFIQPFSELITISSPARVLGRARAFGNQKAHSPDIRRAPSEDWFRRVDANGQIPPFQFGITRAASKLGRRLSDS